MSLSWHSLLPTASSSPSPKMLQREHSILRSRDLNRSGKHTVAAAGEASKPAHGRLRKRLSFKRRPSITSRILQRSTRGTAATHDVHYPNLRSDSPASLSSSSSSSLQSTPSILKQNHPHAVRSTSPLPRRAASHSWRSKTPAPQKPRVSFLNPNCTETVTMHPFLASSESHQAPLCYNIIFPPTLETTLVDRTTRLPTLPMQILFHPATEPVTHSKLILKSEKLPWTIVVTGQCQSKGRALGYSSASSGPVTNLDVFDAIHNSLSIRVTKDEWAALGNGSRAQRKATRAYEKRCVRIGGGWDDGVLRMDLLGDKSVLVAVEVDKDSVAGEGRVCKMIFSTE